MEYLRNIEANNFKQRLALTQNSGRRDQ